MSTSRRHRWNLVFAVMVLWPVASLPIENHVYARFGDMVNLGGGVLLFLAGVASAVVGAILLALNVHAMRKKKIPVFRPWQLPAALLMAVLCAGAIHVLIIKPLFTCEIREACARGI